ncbi:cellulose binding domain-containing protein [Micromonospora sp. BQ11]|uniref:cellulose binding domain-containing protein n=1 Tax=Micromonospora sp. BQ11 TaxID=3452212 RepID=UPI003F894D52
MLASVPWVVVLLGVGLLVGLLLVALLSFRGAERREPVPPPAPPMVLPTLAATPTDTAIPAPTVATPTRPAGTPSAPRAPRTPDLRPGTGSPAAAGRVTARYRVVYDDRKSFEVELQVRNGSAASRDWRVELYFSGGVKGFQASGESGVSVSADGAGSYLLRGTGALDAGESETVWLRINRTGSWERPDLCTVNGTDCAVG